MYRGNKIAVVVPAYNEEELIQETMSGIPDYVDRIYVINDGSTDRTEEIIRNLVTSQIFCNLPEPCLLA
jgi:glycosyltransferase involved in cell wall biosynthesis